MITLFVLFAQLVAAPSASPKATWEDAPVRHLHCPSGWVINHHDGTTDSICRPFSPADRAFQYNGDSQELVYWGQVETIPESGALRIHYAKEFVGQPGCEVIDKSDSENKVSFSAISKSGFTVHGKAGHKLHLNCRGILPRSASDPTGSAGSRSIARTETQSPASQLTRALQTPVLAKQTRG